MQSDRKDKSAAGWDEREAPAAHESQTGSLFSFTFTCSLCIFADYKKGFGGKFGVQSDRKDKSAAGWDEHETLAAHESQTSADCMID